MSGLAAALVMAWASLGPMYGTSHSCDTVARRTAAGESKRSSRAAARRGPTPGVRCRASRSRSSADGGVGITGVRRYSGQVNHHSCSRFSYSPYGARSNSPCQAPAVCSKNPGGQSEWMKGGACGWTTTTTSNSASAVPTGMLRCSTPSAPVLPRHLNGSHVPPPAGILPLRSGFAQQQIDDPAAAYVLAAGAAMVKDFAGRRSRLLPGRRREAAGGRRRGRRRSPGRACGRCRRSRRASTVDRRGRAKRVAERCQRLSRPHVRLFAWA